MDKKLSGELAKNNFNINRKLFFPRIQIWALSTAWAGRLHDTGPGSERPGVHSSPSPKRAVAIRVSKCGACAWISITGTMKSSPDCADAEEPWINRAWLASNQGVVNAAGPTWRKARGARRAGRDVMDVQERKKHKKEKNN